MKLVRSLLATMLLTIAASAAWRLSHTGPTGTDPWAADAQARTPVDITLGKRITLTSRVMSAEQVLMVSLPGNYDQATERYPVLYLLDPETNYGFTAGIAGMLAASDVVPKMIVVGISSTDRNRDFVPTAAKAPTPMQTSPGANTFLSYIDTEVFPYIDRTYRTHPYRILIGHSMGGLFALHATVTRPELFDAYVSISPAVWWNEMEYVDLVAREIGRRPSFKKYLFLSMADEGREVWPALKRLEDTLKTAAPKDFRFDFRYFGDESHATTAVESTFQGLKRVYANWQAPRAAINSGVDALVAHYARLSDEFGYTIPVPERTLEESARNLSFTGKTAAAIQVLEFRASRYPQSQAAHVALAEQYLRGGEKAKARASLEKVLALNPEHAAARRLLAEANK